MKLIQRKDIDESKWASWCKASPESMPFVALEYLDAVAENIVFAINEEETGGIALPYFDRLGVKTLYTPVFCRWVDWIGDKVPKPEVLKDFLKNEFKEVDIYFRKKLLDEKSNDLIYQDLTKDEFKLNSQAKRKIKSIEKGSYKITESADVNKGLELIRNELSGKFETLDDTNFDSLDVLTFNMLKIKSLICLELRLNDVLKGVLFLIQTEHSILYLKGACASDAKKNGGMYALMNRAIFDAFDSNRNFDFGGSRIEGVRRFNKCFGGQDKVYFHYKWSDSPIWYKAAKSLKDKWKKK